MNHRHLKSLQKNLWCLSICHTIPTGNNPNQLHLSLQAHLKSLSTYSSASHINTVTVLSKPHQDYRCYSPNPGPRPDISTILSCKFKLQANSQAKLPICPRTARNFTCTSHMMNTSKLNVVLPTTINSYDVITLMVHTVTILTEINLLMNAINCLPTNTTRQGKLNCRINNSTPFIQGNNSCCIALFPVITHPQII